MSSPTMTDRVYLDFWNGRPSLLLTVQDGAPYLWWLLAGQTEDFDIWWVQEVTWEQADAITAHPQHLDVWTFVETHASDNVQVFVSPRTEVEEIRVTDSPLRWHGVTDGGGGQVRGILKELDAILLSLREVEPHAKGGAETVEQVLAALS